MQSTSVSRRAFLAGSAGLLISPLAAESIDKPESNNIAFFVVGDTHFLADKTAPEKLDAVSNGVTSKLVETLNRLPGTAIPEEIGGGKVLAPKGVIHAGDLIDTGDKTGATQVKMQKTEYEAYQAAFGLTGKDGKLKYPVYEVHGNHDAPQGQGLMIDKIIERNKTRPDVTHRSKNGLHYSWDWGPFHFVCLGIVVGAVKKPERKRRYPALDSLEFLETDLADKVGKSGRPVILTHHIDVARYSSACDIDAEATNKEWDACDVQGYFKAIEKYNVVSILYGHTHARAIFRWDGTPTRATKGGVPVFNVDNSAHFNSKEQAFFYFHFDGKELVVREYQTANRWESGKWTPQVWKVPVTLPN